MNKTKNTKSTKATTTYASREVAVIDVDSIHEQPGFNARGEGWREEDAFSELVKSIREHGVIQPIAVRRDGEGFVVVAGHRRLAAASEAGLASVPCIVLGADEDVQAVNLIENIVREKLSPSEEALGVAGLALGTTATQVASSLGKSLSWVSKRIKVARAIGEGKVTREDVNTLGVEPIYTSLSLAAKTEGNDGAKGKGKAKGKGDGGLGPTPEGELPSGHDEASIYVDCTLEEAVRFVKAVKAKGLPVLEVKVRLDLCCAVEDATSGLLSLTTLADEQSLKYETLHLPSR